MTDAPNAGAPHDAAYSLREYGAMFAAPHRHAAMVEAMRAVVHPGSIVVELGTGAGQFAILACQLGAAHVYAIEADPIVELARLLVADNGCADRVTSIHARSQDVSLPEPVDVLIADLRGTLPFYHGSVASIIDARRRMLKPRGVVVPRRDVLWAAVASAPESYDALTRAWRDGPLGLDLRRALTMATNHPMVAPLTPDQIVSTHASWGAIDYATVGDPGISGSARCVIERGGPAHGLCAWFDAELAPGIEFSNAPGSPLAVYQRLLFPWPAPTPVEPGDVVTTTIHVTPAEIDYTWTWETSICSAAGDPRATFRQSSFLGTPFSHDALRRRAHRHVPHLSSSGAISRTILSLIDGQRTLGDIATDVHARFPEAFPTWQAALDRVATVSGSAEARGSESGESDGPA